jgi:uncharacterized membrane protein YccC
MNLAAACNAKTLASGMGREFMAWGETEGKGWIFVFKTTLAALLAMGISMRFELGQPATAMVTVYVIMQPQTGMVLTKSVYRICGTLAGATASLVLVALFSQEPVLFLLGLSLWVGLCTAGATLHRNFKSYGFTLAGYTAAMIALPLAMQPTGFFDYAVNRVTEVVIGVICCGIVSGMVFPQSLGTTIVQTLHSRYAEFIGFVHAMLTGGIQRHEIDRMHLRFIGSILNLESFRGAVMREATGMRGRDHCLHRLNRDFMAASTTFHSLHQLLKRLKKSDSPSAHELTTLTESLADVLVPENRSVPTAEAAHRTARRLAEFRATFFRRTEMVRQTCIRIPDHRASLDCETALELLRRFVRELHDYTATYASLMADRPETEPLEDARFASRTDPAVALLTGARAMIAVLLVAAFWIASAWPFGGIAVMMAAIGSSLFAPTPDPARAVKMADYGFILAFVAAYLCKFYVMTSVDGFWLLCTCMAPFLFVGPYLSLNPKFAALGLGYGTMFCFIMSPTNSMQYDPVTYINFGSALILGMAAAAVIFGLFAPVTGVWLKRRTVRLLQRQMETACSGKLPGLIHRFESGMRDIPQRLAAGQALQDPHDRNILEWMFIVLEVGRAVIHLRQEIATIDLPQPLLESLTNSIRSTADLFRRPDAPRHNAALESVEESIAMLLTESDGGSHGSYSRGALRRMLTALHLIRTSLLDDETILAATVTGPLTPPKGASPHAA